jgi:hypothetical protein
MATPYAGVRTVEVDLRISVDVSGDVSILGVQPTLPSSNIVVVTAGGPTTALKALSLFGAAAGSGFDASSGIIEYWENASTTGRDEVVAQVTATGGAEHGATWATHRALIKADLQALLCNPTASPVNSLDFVAATPFSNHTDAAAYYSYNSIGESMLAYAAQRMFGHPAATAAIDNDQDLVDFGNNADGFANPLDLAEKLVAALGALSAPNAAKIAMEVLGQDAARADIAKDNNSGIPSKHAILPFLAGDIIYVGVKFTGFTTSIGAQTYGAGVTSSTPAQQLTAAAMDDRLTDEQYYLKITLA